MFGGHSLCICLCRGPSHYQKKTGFQGEVGGLKMLEWNFACTLMFDYHELHNLFFFGKRLRLHYSLTPIAIGGPQIISNNLLG